MAQRIKGYGKLSWDLEKGSPRLLLTLDSKESGDEAASWYKGSFYVARVAKKVYHDPKHLRLTLPLLKAFQSLSDQRQIKVIYHWETEGQIIIELSGLGGIRDSDGLLKAIAKQLTDSAHAAEKAHPEFTAGQWRRTYAERAVLRGLESEPRIHTPECVEPDVLIELIEQGGNHPQAEVLNAHIVNCAYCRNEYGEMRQMLQLATTACEILDEQQL